MAYLGADFHFQNIARGVIDSRDLLYYLSVTAVALFAAVRSLGRHHATVIHGIDTIEVDQLGVEVEVVPRVDENVVLIAKSLQTSCSKCCYLGCPYYFHAIVCIHFCVLLSKDGRALETLARSQVSEL